MRVSSADSAESWNREYSAQGIPSSWKADASTVVKWFISNAVYLGRDLSGATALDIGCGTGRNSMALAAQGASVVGVDYSAEAIAKAQGILSVAGDLPVQFSEHDLRKGVPAEDSSIDIILDVFVYFNQLSSADRAEYRRELKRVLRPNGLVLLSLATDEDGYYSSCPLLTSWQDISDVKLVYDPVAEVGNVLFSEAELMSEFGDLFSPRMTWRKVASGPMHGKAYERHTFATVWSV